MPWVAEAQLQLERVLRLGGRVPDAAARAGSDRMSLLSRRAEAAYAAGEPARAAQLVRQALPLTHEARQPARAGLLHEQLARCLRMLGDPGALAQQEEAVAIAAKVAASAEEANARTALGTALGALGETDAGLAELAAAHRLAADAGEAVLMVPTMVNRSDLLLAAGRLDEAATVALAGMGEARRLELGLGDLDAAEAQLRTARPLIPSPISEAQRSGPLYAGLAELAFGRGNLEQAGELVAEAVPVVEASPRYAAPLYALGLRIEADRAELARARRPGHGVLDDGTAAALLERLGHAAAAPAARGLPELAAWHATGLAERARRDARPDPAAAIAHRLGLD
jgi:tetratricopeptide (TPR) repeat protein